MKARALRIRTSSWWTIEATVACCLTKAPSRQTTNGKINLPKAEAYEFRSVGVVWKATAIFAGERFGSTPASGVLRAYFLHSGDRSSQKSPQDRHDRLDKELVQQCSQWMLHGPFEST